MIVNNLVEYETKTIGKIEFNCSPNVNVRAFQLIGIRDGSNEHWLLDDRTSKYKRDVEDGI